MRRVMTVIAMTGSQCNLSCRYCYVSASRRNVRRFDPAKVRTLVHNCSFGFDSVEFCWHGGEPLLAGIDFYRSAVAAQQEASAQRGVVFRNNLQTNGTLLDNAWLRFFQEHDFHLGLSFDAPPEVHAVHRRMDVGQYLSTSKELTKYGFPLGALCVVSALNAEKGQEIFKFFDEVGVTSYTLLPLKQVPLPDCPPAPDNDQLFELYRTTFDMWAGQRSRIVCIDPIDTMVRGLLGERPRSCSFASSCLGQMITIDQEGNVVPCSSLVAEEFVLGNVLESPLLDILCNQQTRRYRNLRSRSMNKHCQGCEFISICRGGCRADAFWHSGRYDGEYPYCRARKLTFEYLKRRLEKIVAPGH